MKTFRLTSLTLGILALFTANVSHAEFLNLGTLDVKAVGSETQNAEWFVQYADRGENIIRFLQIANFSPENKEVEIYSTDGSIKLTTNFTVNSKEQTSEKISPWITTPQNTLVLKSGETKVVPVKISVPKNAGVGLHTGAMMVREKTKANGTEFHVEKGVRVYLNVKGSAIDKAVATGSPLSAGLNSAQTNLFIENKGTTDFDSNLTLELQNFNGETVAQQSQAGYVRPGETKTIKLQSSTPTFGIYQAVLKSEQPLNGETTLAAGTLIIVPLWGLLLIGALALSGSFFAQKATTSIKSKSLTFDPRALFRSLQFQKATSFFGILLVSGLMSVPLLSMDGKQGYFAAVLEPGNPESYEVTVKWGNIKKTLMNKKNTKDWHGEIRLTNAKASIKQLLNLEAQDAINVVNDGTTVNFNISTSATNNDGVILSVTPTSNNQPKLEFENFPTETKTTVNLSKINNGTIVIPNKEFSASINIKPLTSTELHGASTTIAETNATPEPAATPEVTINIPELKNIFSDIPATPEVLSEFILTSDYVKKITTQNASTRIDTDSDLIKALASTPEIIEEITATPNLNFTFIPSETITFPPQQFSFKQDKNSTQDLGTIIFVQNKETPWNTYIGTTNFVSVSGRGVIPAGNLTIIPGDAKILKKEDGAQINEGTQKNIEGTFDKSILVNVDPGVVTGDQKTIFSMNPKLQIKIPRGTPPGKYRGLLTITSL